MSFFDHPGSGQRGHSSLGTHRGYVGSRRAARLQAKRDRRRARAAAIVALICVAALLIGGGFLGWRALLKLQGADGEDYPGPGEGQVVVEIADGLPIKSIGSLLAQKNVVASQGAFVRAAQDNQDSLMVRPGWYKLRERMSAKQALEALLDPSSRAELRVTIPEGLRAPEIMQRLAAARGLPVEQFNSALTHPDLGLPDYARGKTEGFLYPSTYEFSPNATALQMVQAMITRYTTKTQEIKIDQLAPRRSAEQILIIASLVQAEAKHAPDFPKVARVIYNRLEKPMPLQFDSTVNYALGRTKVRVSIKDTQVNSPYNTYRNPGLPPGPINSPGEQAIQAALQPAVGNWLFFVTVDEQSGQTKFVDTYAEHEVLVRELDCYRTARAQGKTPACGP